MCVLARRLDEVRAGAERPFLFSTAIRVAARFRRSARRRADGATDEDVEALAAAARAQVVAGPSVTARQPTPSAEPATSTGSSVPAELATLDQARSAIAGDRPAAQRAADAFLAVNPQSPYAARIRSIVETNP